jgi:hypothetical protein
MSMAELQAAASAAAEHMVTVLFNQRFWFQGELGIDDLAIWPRYALASNGGDRRR